MKRTRVTSEILYRCHVFSLRREWYRSPDDDGQHDFYVLETPEWVNIIPVTPDGLVVMVRQYRHGIRDMTLEIPGGMVEPQDGSSLHAARREMEEETGYTSEDVLHIGSIHPNPAIQTNRCHSFLARNVIKREDAFPRGTEETEVALIPLPEIPALIRGGTISHALVVTAFYWYYLHTGGQADGLPGG